MKIFEFAGIVFNADNICTIQKVNMKKETGDELVAGLQVVTIAGGVNFSFDSEKERDTKYDEILANMRVL